MINIIIFNYRLIIFTLSIIFVFVFAIPSLLQTDSGKKISLGLDLQGGLHMLLGVNTHEAVTSKIKTIATSVKYFSEDEIKALEENAHKMTDKYIAAVDEAVEVKTKEILTV